MTRLFDLLPAFYRMRDNRIAQSQVLLSPAEQAYLQQLATLTARPLTPGEQQQLDQLKAKAARGPLQSLLMLVEEQLAIFAENLDQLYDDRFIETCAPWVIPYIGDLIGFQPVNGIAPAVASPRAEVAHTISFRRRKGTVLAMEQLARDVTGWGAHAVEFFQVLATTQYMNHLRPQHHSPDVRRWKTGFYLNTGFDRTPHTLDVRRIPVGSGRYNVQNIGIFLWSLNVYSLTRSPATGVEGSAQCFRFSPLGLDMPLFNNPVSQGADIAEAAGPLNVPARLRRRVLCEDLRNASASAYYGEGSSVALYIGGQLLNAEQIQVCNLSDSSGSDGSWINVPQTGSPYAAAIDPELGRIALPPSAAGSTPQLQASFYYGFNADLGGGEYARQATFIVQDDVLSFPAPQYATLQDALSDAKGQLKENGKIAVEIADSGVYTASSLNVDLPAGAAMELRAADGARPTLFLTGEIVPTGAPSSVFALNGILIRGAVHAPAARPDGSPNQLSQLSLTHCTLVPGSQPTLLAEPPGLQVVVGKSILGAIRVGEPAAANLADSIVDAISLTGVAYSALDNSSGGGPLTLTGCTVVGKIHATLLNLVSNSIIRAASAASEAPLWSDRRQTGCVRFSYLPPGSVTPRQFECVEQVPQSPEPLFFSLQYGDPGYSKLLTSPPDAVRRGADDGGEMGAFHFVLAPLREDDLRVRLQEYVPVGMEFGIIYQN
jgi:hypothetical protein